MKFNKRLIPTLLLASSLSLTGCGSFLKGLLNGLDTSGNESETSYNDHFVNTDGDTVYVYLNVSNKTLLKEMQLQLNLDVAKEGEEPDFVGSWTGVTWKSENTSVATVDDKGLVTAVGNGETKITAAIFSCLVYAEIKVIDKELDYVTVNNPRKTFIKDKTFIPSFELVATLKGGFTETITEYSVDSSEVNMSTVGDYPVNVYGTYLEKDFEVSYTISVKDAVTYDAKSLDYDYRDLHNNRSNPEANGWYMPNSGNVKSLVIPVWFTNSGSMISDRNDLRTKIDTAFNGAQLENGWNSVKTYYYELSNHTLNYNATISEWYEAGNTYSYFQESAIKYKQLICDAVDWYFANNPSETRKSYDSDNNGVFDSICILYGSNESSQGMIHFENYYNKTDSDHPGLKYHMWASVFEATQDLSHCEGDSHVYIHETGHMLGLVDYYDYGGDTRPAGGFNMQEHNTGSHEAYSITALGWGKVIVPETDTIIELEDYESSHVAVLLSSHPESQDSPFDEYVLLEMFAPTGTKKFDATYKWRGFYSNGPQDVGIRLWHVDARLTHRDSYSEGYSTDLVTDPRTLNATEAFSNTSTGTNHGSTLGEEYNKYSMLFNIRNNAPTEDYYGSNISVINETHLFRTGDSFAWGDFTNQFTEGSKMNDGSTFGWTFSVDSINTIDGKAVATLNITRL